MCKQHVLCHMIVSLMTKQLAAAAHLGCRKVHDGCDDASALAHNLKNIEAHLQLLSSELHLCHNLYCSFKQVCFLTSILLPHLGLLHCTLACKANRTATLAKAHCCTQQLLLLHFANKPFCQKCAVDCEHSVTIHIFMGPHTCIHNTIWIHTKHK